MSALSALAGGLAVATTPANLLFALLGCILGTAVGVMPGVGPALAVAMLLPLTAQVEPTGALIMFAGIYYGAMFGGSTTSILLNTPGESATLVTALEGNQMARRGRAGPALATAAIGSFVAGTIATVLLSLFAPRVVQWALAFGPVEYFALAVLAFAAVASLLGASLLRGLSSLALGLALGMVGMDQISGQVRFTFGLPALADGIEVVLVAVALFAVAEALHAVVFERDEHARPMAAQTPRMTADDWRRSWPAWLRGTAIGFPFGTMPAGGAEIPTFLSYALEKRLSRRPEEFGRGAIEGVAGPEAANNAAATGTLVPLLTLGIPTSATAAVLLAAFQSYGLQPGPLLFESSPALVWGLIASLYVGNVMLLVLNLPLVSVWVRLLRIPRPQLYAGILVFATLGVYGMKQSWVDLCLLWALGLVGMLMRRFDYPAAPLVVGLILGPLAEKNLRNALALGEGHAGVLLSSPISVVLLGASALAILAPPLLRRLRAA